MTSSGTWLKILHNSSSSRLKNELRCCANGEIRQTIHKLAGLKSSKIVESADSILEKPLGPVEMAKLVKHLQQRRLHVRNNMHVIAMLIHPANVLLQQLLRALKHCRLQGLLIFMQRFIHVSYARPKEGRANLVATRCQSLTQRSFDAFLRQ